MKNVKSQLILCQPDSNKGCCVCCGLFNHVDIAKSNLERFLSSSKHRIINRIEVNDSKLNSKSILTEIRDSTTFICPYQGFIHKKAPGCLLHKSVNGFDARDMSFFGQDICDSFLCPAHNILNNRQKTILIEYINDWFYYSLAIALPLSFIWILERLENDYDLDLSNSHNNNQKTISSIYAAMDIHLDCLKKIKTSIFHYSISEYNQYKHQFSLTSNLDDIQVVKKRIKQVMDKILG